METDDDEREQEREQEKREKKKERDFMGSVIVQAAAIRRMNQRSGWRDKAHRQRDDEQSGQPEDSVFQPIHPEAIMVETLADDDHQKLLGSSTLQRLDTTTVVAAANTAAATSVPFVIRTTLHHRGSSPAESSLSLARSDDDTDDEYRALVDAVHRYTERAKARAKLRARRQKLRAYRTKLRFVLARINTLTVAARELRLHQIDIATDDDNKKAVYDAELHKIDEEMEICHKKRRNIERKINNIDASD
jgi:hypothetical protein